MFYPGPELDYRAGWSFDFAMAAQNAWRQRERTLVEAGAALYALVEGDDSLAIEARRDWLTATSLRPASETPQADSGATE